MSLTTTIAVTSLCIERLNELCLEKENTVRSSPLGVKPLCLQIHPLTRKTNTTCASTAKRAFRSRLASLTCAAVLNTSCAPEKQTVTRQSFTITAAPIKELPRKENPSELDDGWTNFPPCDLGSGTGDDGGGGGGGGGGGSGGGGEWSGGFFLFAFLAFLFFLKEKESEVPYLDEKRRQKSYAY